MNRKKLILLILGLAALVGTVSAAVLQYFGQVQMTATVKQAVLLDGKDITEMPITEEVEVAGGESFCRYHWLKSQTSVPVELEFVTDKGGAGDEISVTYYKILVSAYLSINDNNLYMSFYVKEGEETFLLVYMDTREGGTIYDYGDTGTDIRADYMIVDPAVGAFADWYLGKWLREDLGDPYTGWSTPSTYGDGFEDNDWDCGGFVAEESRTDGYTHYEFTIPLECIEYDPEYGLNLLVHTGLGFGDWVSQTIGATNYEMVEEITSQFTLQPYERLDFCIKYEFAVDIYPGTYKITTTVEPVT